MNYEDAWIVLEGWGNEPKLVFPDEDSALVASKLLTGSNVKIIKLSEHIDRIRRTARKDVILELDREWTQARNSVTWKD